MILKQQKQNNEKTEAARRRFHTPAYNIGERRRDADTKRLDRSVYQYEPYKDN